MGDRKPEFQIPDDVTFRTADILSEGTRMAAEVFALKALDGLNVIGGEKFGVEIIKKSLEEPIRQIVQNGGWEGSIVVAKVREGQGAYGFNAATGQYEDLLAAGVIDPTKVSRFALQNASSVASLMLTTEAMVAERPKDKEESPAPGGHGMGM